MTLMIPSSTSGTTSPADPRRQELRDVAVELEATFLAEMLKAAGLGESRQSLGGGAGEDQYTSFLVLEQARHIARAGGIGLAESLYNSLLENENGNRIHSGSRRRT